MNLSAYVTATNDKGEEIKLQLQVERKKGFSGMWYFDFTILESSIPCAFIKYIPIKTGPSLKLSIFYSFGVLDADDMQKAEQYMYVVKSLDPKDRENRFFIEYNELLANLGMRTFFDELKARKTA